VGRTLICPDARSHHSAAGQIALAAAFRNGLLHAAAVVADVRRDEAPINILLDGLPDRFMVLLSYAANITRGTATHPHPIYGPGWGTQISSVFASSSQRRCPTSRRTARNPRRRSGPG
jgi:hypothetical protein